MMERRYRICRYCKHWDFEEVPFEKLPSILEMFSNCINPELYELIKHPVDGLIQTSWGYGCSLFKPKESLFVKQIISLHDWHCPHCDTENKTSVKGKDLSQVCRCNKCQKICIISFKNKEKYNEGK